MLMLINSIYSEITLNRLLMILIRSTNMKLFLFRSEWILASVILLLVNAMFNLFLSARNASIIRKSILT